MRVMVIVKASPDSEAGVIPSTAEFEAMGRFNEKLANAGVMLVAEGLLPSSRGATVRFDGDRRSVIDGRLPEAKDLVAGFWVWQVRSMDEAVEWLKQAPFREGDVEIRPIAEADDLGDAYTPELREQDERLRDRIGARGA